MTGSHSRLRRPALWMAPDEPDQVLRLMQFRKEHPDMVIGTDEFGTWQARIPNQTGRLSSTGTGSASSWIGSTS